nr:SIR2 family protein [uncultured Celeribacter sp.]
MQDVWEGGSITEDEKELIRRCLPTGVDAPQNEDQLADLQEVVDACETVLRFEENDRGNGDWLTETGQAFPDAIRYYVHAVASEFHSETHDTNLEPPSEFLDALNENLLNEGSTIATTNYDGALYRGLCDRSSFKSYTTLDGFQGNPPCFHEALRRTHNKKGYYFHLHGSPLFVDDGADIRKLPREDVRNRTPASSRHLVLTHETYKTKIIDNSELLRAYWTKLSKLSNDFDRIVWLGHSGRDPHLNRFIARYFPAKPITIVEWNGAGNQAEREEYWKNKFSAREIKLIPMEKLTAFVDW